MIALLFTALGALAALQEGAPEPSLGERIEALIESTNEVDSFRARYVLARDGAPDAEFVISYSAPDRARISIERGAEGVESHADTWVVDGVLSVRADDGQGGLAVGELDMREPAEAIAAASELLAERFPPPEPGIGPGPILVMSWGINPETDKTDFDLKLAYEREDRKALLGWLVKLQRSVEQLELQDGRFVLEPDPRIRVEVSAESGFVERLELIGSDGSEAHIELRELEVGFVPNATTYDLPGEVPGAVDVFADGGERLRGHPRDFRRGCFARVDVQLQRGQIEWDASTRSDWRDLLAALHGPLVQGSFSAWSARSQARSEEFTKRLAAEVAKAGDQQAVDELRGVAARWRGALVENLMSSYEAFAKTLRKPGSLPIVLAHSEELLGVEAEVVREAFQAMVETPLLEAFDELVDATFDV